MTLATASLNYGNAALDFSYDRYSYDRHIRSGNSQSWELPESLFLFLAMRRKGSKIAYIRRKMKATGHVCHQDPRRVSVQCLIQITMKYLSYDLPVTIIYQ